MLPPTPLSRGGAAAGDVEGLLDPWAEGNSPEPGEPPRLPSSSSSPSVSNGQSLHTHTTSIDPSSSLHDSSELLTTDSAPQRSARPFRTAPLTSLPRRLDELALDNDQGPRRRHGTPPRTSTELEPYGGGEVAAASGSAYARAPNGSGASSPARSSASHPLAVDDIAGTAGTPPRRPTVGRMRSRSAVDPSGVLSPLSGASLSPSASPARARTPGSLAGLGGMGGAALADLRDVSRPALARVTSETERAASVGSWSAASSDAGGADDDRVDVIVHTVTANESLPGIALRYGTDVATLRKANKLWPTDPVHLRRTLYVPLDACRPTADSEIVRSESEVTLVRRHLRSAAATPTRTPDMSPRLDDAEPRSLADAHPVAASSSSSLTQNGDASRADGAATPTVETIPLTIASVPASHLRFFPRQRAIRARTSLDSEPRGGSLRVSSSSSRRPGLFAALAGGLDGDADDNDEYEERLRTPHRVTLRSGEYAPGSSNSYPSTPSAPHTADRTPSSSSSATTASYFDAVALPKSKSRVVRLRPPTAAPASPSSSGTLAARLSSFFTVPPPPAHAQAYPVPRVPAGVPAASLSGGGSVRKTVGSAELVEMDARPPPRVPHRTPRTSNTTTSDKKRD